jgi:hypothetical protein
VSAARPAGHDRSVALGGEEPHPERAARQSDPAIQGRSVFGHDPEFAKSRRPCRGSLFDATQKSVTPPPIEGVRLGPVNHVEWMANRRVADDDKDIA